MFNVKISLILIGLIIHVTDVLAQNESLIDILEQELNREFKILSKADNPVYYMDYHVRESNQLLIQCAMGSLISSNQLHNRMANIGIRVGSYQLDNTHEQNQYNQQGHMSVPIPLDNDKEAISQMLWMMTDVKYQDVVEQFKRINTDDSTSADFSSEPAEVYIGELKDVDMDEEREQMEEKLKRLSALFLKNSDINNGEVSLNRLLETKYFVSSEGSKVVHQIMYNFLSINASILDSEGEIIPLHKTYFVYEMDDLPDENSLEEDIKQMIRTLTELQVAPLAEPYTGPAILDPRAAGVFFHEIFGHRIEGSRLNNDFDSQTFKEKVGELVLPKSMNVFMDPTINELGGHALIGHYAFDDEGTRAQKVEVVKQGILKNFLMTRKPMGQFKNSNGHARTQGGATPVSRQSNLIVESTKQIAKEDLRKRLIKECKKQGKEYGYYFVDVEGGFTNTNRFMPNAFNIMPTIVYRIYVDGRPDELVRGVDLIGTPLSMFAEIKACSQEQDTFNGFCGAESGQVPVSATSPGLLVRRIETQKKVRQINKDETPILSRPLRNHNDDK